MTIYDTLATKESTIVLLVDDQRLVAEAVRRALAEEDEISFHYCSDPKKAISTIDSLHPTCILQDLVMPEIGGLELVKMYRQHEEFKHIPVIVLSTREEPEVKSKAFAAGANDYLVKLPDSVELIARVKYHSKGYIVQQQRDIAYKALQESERKLAEANRQLQKLSSQDGLTHIPNRRRFDEMLYKEWHRAMRHSTSLSMIMIDIDFFKFYNDHYGHSGGDDCLRKVAQILKATVQRESDILARYGGEEFAVILPETGINGASEVAEQMRQQIYEARIPHSKSAVCQFVTISLGVASAVPERSSDPSCLIKAADKALYQAKQNGRNTIATFFEVLIY
ncbi:MAG: diguanylate cyclase [Deltaproteobacteria bacterium]